MSTALYRRYRPETFADVIGQEHVTEPLMTALRKDRVNHAYLFSGPRGCGKTTSARILARCLNCAQGPTATPCGQCPSCIELARGGSGSLDVIEIDAASHGGVDDARDLRERATFAPVRDHYKIFIIDEAHMVTSAGFNALLKIVEEPPEHIKFIFATTEPDKVIGTIRSRTHHYPFRLVPPEPLMGYLDSLCQQESVPVAPGVLSLVVRAGGGSVRDSLSVLDQLMAGAGESGLDYELAVSLLGYTHASLLDDVVEAVAATDAATVFGAVDRVIQTGHDPRRFVEDLLERFRDLIIINAMPESSAAVLRGVPADQLARLQTQANQLGAGELSRAADITNTALTEMTGATSPRLHLELLCARILLPGADQGERGVTARVDRIERRLSYADPSAGSAAGAGQIAGSNSSAAPSADKAPAATSTTSAGSGATHGPTQDEALQIPEPTAEDAPVSGTSKASAPKQDQDQPAPTPAPEPVSASPPKPPVDAPPAPSGSESTESKSGSPAAPAAGQVEMIRRAWPEIMDTLAGIKRATWMVVVNEATPRAFDGSTLELVFKSPGNAIGFNRANHLDNLSQAINQVLGLQIQINPLHDASAAAGDPDPKAPSRQRPATSVADSNTGWGGSAVAGEKPAESEDGPASSPEPEERSEIWAPARPKEADLGQDANDSWGLREPPQDSPEPYESREPPVPEEQPVPEPVEEQPVPEPVEEQPVPEPDNGKPLSRYQRMLNEAAVARHGAAGTAEQRPGHVDLAYVEDVPNADDETIEESGLVGRAAIERILNGRLVEERSLDAV
ncbi:DNA polymerase III subunit gamma and tau [Arthrobacter roseus]|uniref:DNA polymerase III subunit gamma and tau n=1 Tax=Arthrobacter roseus TaxID=136274 RepID=UPI0019638D96|nr:DNA polymerase-3 subunit gamma/tau [Arthrobacter roseus]